MTSAEVYEHVLDRDGERCHVCGKTQKLEMHHVIPKSSGGETTPENCIMLCGPILNNDSCHNKVHYSGSTYYTKYLCSGSKGNSKFLIELRKREKRISFTV